jgi:uncharacterized protein (DUF1330 family)
LPASPGDGGRGGIGDLGLVAVARNPAGTVSFLERGAMSTYVIVELSVVNAEPYERYKALAEASVVAHGGVYKVRGGRIESVEGEPVTDRLVVLEFPDWATARAWYASPEYQEALPLRLAAAETTRLFIAEGYEPD